MTALPDITTPGALAALADEADPTSMAVLGAVFDTARRRLDPGEQGWVDAIEALRRATEASFDEIDTAWADREPKLAPIGEICHRRSKSPRWALLLLLLVRRLRPARVLEMGTCLGISGAYLGAGLQLNGSGRLVTLEGAPALAEQAHRHFELLGLCSIEVTPGLFRTTLGPAIDDLGSVDLAFIDGHHDEKMTQQYFEQVLAHLAPPAVIVLDDISWSDGMERAWTAICSHPAVRVAVDLHRMGICIIGGEGSSRRLPIGELDDIASPPKLPSKTQAADVVLEQLPTARLNLGCGSRGEEGWLNADLRPGPGVNLVGDVRDGLAIRSESLDYIVSVHALPMIPLPDLPGVLNELRRTLKPGGVLRLGLPDLSRAVAAWRTGCRDYFLVPDDDARTLSGKLITQLLWYGHSVTLFTAEFAEELLLDAGYQQVYRCDYRESASRLVGITELDNREMESFFVEAIR